MNINVFFNHLGKQAVDVFVFHLTEVKSSIMFTDNQSYWFLSSFTHSLLSLHHDEWNMMKTSLPLFVEAVV